MTHRWDTRSDADLMAAKKQIESALSPLNAAIQRAEARAHAGHYLPADEWRKLQEDRSALAARVSLIDKELTLRKIAAREHHTGRHPIPDFDARFKRTARKMLPPEQFRAIVSAAESETLTAECAALNPAPEEGDVVLHTEDLKRMREAVRARVAGIAAQLTCSMCGAKRT